MHRAALRFSAAIADERAVAQIGRAVIRLKSCAAETAVFDEIAVFDLRIAIVRHLHGELAIICKNTVDQAGRAENADAYAADVDSYDSVCDVETFSIPEADDRACRFKHH